MRRFWSLALAIMILLASLAAAEPLAAPDSVAGSDVQLPDSFSNATRGSSFIILDPGSFGTQQPASDDASEAEQPSPELPEVGADAAQEPTAASSLPGAQLVSGELLDLVFDLLGDQDLSLSLEEVYDGSRMELTLRRTDADRLELLCNSDEGEAVRVLIDAQGVTIEIDGTSMRYGFDELLEELAFELSLDELTYELGLADSDPQALLGILSGLAPSAEDEAFLMQLLEIAVDELAQAGLDFEPLETYDGAYLHLEFSPKLLCNAIVRFMDRALEYEDEIDALLARYDAPLRALLPELFEIYNPLTKENVQRDAYSCAELKAVWPYARQELLCQWTDNAGATLEIYADDSGACRLNLQIRELLDGGNAVLVLDFDEDGNASGTLTLMQRDYGYGLAAQVFDIDLSLSDSGMMLRVIPRTPIGSFTLLTANLFSGYDGTAFDLTTDALRLRLHADSEGLCGSLELVDEFSADLNLAFEDELHGSLILSEDGYSHVLRLNE